LAIGVEKGFLRQILGERHVPDISEDEAVQAIGVAHDQAIKLGGVPGQYRVYERLIALRLGGATLRDYCPRHLCSIAL
jgi:hypothetical protein